eukprot:130428-Prorocentrum_minimum.AAC.1
MTDQSDAGSAGIFLQGSTRLIAASCQVLIGRLQCRQAGLEVGADVVHHHDVGQRLLRATTRMLRATMRMLRATMKMLRATMRMLRATMRMSSIIMMLGSAWGEKRHGTRSAPRGQTIRPLRE